MTLDHSPSSPTLVTHSPSSPSLKRPTSASRTRAKALNVSPSESALRNATTRSRTGLSKSSLDLAGREEDLNEAARVRHTVTAELDADIKELNLQLAKTNIEGGWLKLKSVASTDFNGRIGFGDFLKLCRRRCRCQWDEKRLKAVWDYAAAATSPVDDKIQFHRLCAFLTAENAGVAVRSIPKSKDRGRFSLR